MRREVLGGRWWGREVFEDLRERWDLLVGNCWCKSGSSWVERDMAEIAGKWLTPLEFLLTFSPLALTMNLNFDYLPRECE